MMREIRRAAAASLTDNNLSSLLRLLGFLIWASVVVALVVPEVLR